jgi:hypothetical protein
MAAEERTPTTELPSTLQCWSSAIVAGGMSYGMYILLSNTVIKFASKPIGGTTNLAINIAATVRTLLVGICALGVAVFGIIAVSLFALGIQVAVSGRKPAGDS